MKKRERIKRKDNIIFFPGLDKRLTDKGLESLEKKKFSEAIPLLEEARELDPDNENILIGLVLAYFEAGAFEKAKVLANEMLLKGIGDYFQMVDLYLTVLIQLHQYQEIVTTIEALLDEREIPPEKHDHFLTLLQFSRRMAESHGPQEEADWEEAQTSEVPELNLLSNDHINEKLLLIANLTDKNIRPYLDEITDYLKFKDGHPFLKTMLLNLLKEQEIAQELIVEKFAIAEKIVPAQLPEVREQLKMLEVKGLLAEQLENKNPGLFQNTVNMVERTFFISYPIELEPKSAESWAAAFDMLGREYMGMDPEISKIAGKYGAEIPDLEKARERIEAIEKISYPNI
ncbi:tetratricopeptide repeat protein [Neobacillus cucumis]|uniref:tetratricopeptide repeat protein n=1 Tax=Neobacillus cucumis TaxID=1740721 RepID=UPI001965F962|nr:tetratricopeptide repeat protein [Neobacillus cucumis]MBM7653058.1 tetratricopeptide (TPR) repeat protein [Neobacillus cucumis]